MCASGVWGAADKYRLRSESNVSNDWNDTSGQYWQWYGTDWGITSWHNLSGSDYPGVNSDAEVYLGRSDSAISLKLSDNCPNDIKSIYIGKSINDTVYGKGDVTLDLNNYDFNVTTVNFSETASSYAGKTTALKLANTGTNLSTFNVKELTFAANSFVHTITLASNTKFVHTDTAILNTATLNVDNEGIVKFNSFTLNNSSSLIVNNSGTFTANKIIVPASAEVIIESNGSHEITITELQLEDGAKVTLKGKVTVNKLTSNGSNTLFVDSGAEVKVKEITKNSASYESVDISGAGKIELSNVDLSGAAQIWNTCEQLYFVDDAVSSQNPSIQIAEKLGNAGDGHIFIQTNTSIGYFDAGAGTAGNVTIDKNGIYIKATRSTGDKGGKIKTLNISQPTTINGSFEIATLKIDTSAIAALSTVTVKAGETLNVTDSSTFKGNSVDNPLVLTSDSASAWNYNGPVPAAEYTQVTKSESTNALNIEGSRSTILDSGLLQDSPHDYTTTNWFKRPTEYTWNGSDDISVTNWKNWEECLVPGMAAGSTDKITIPSGCGNYPVLDANFEIGTLIIEENASFNFKYFGVKVNTKFKNSGKIQIQHLDERTSKRMFFPAGTSSYENGTWIFEPYEGSDTHYDAIENITYNNVEISPDNSGTTKTFSKGTVRANNVTIKSAGKIYLDNPVADSDTIWDSPVVLDADLEIVTYSGGYNHNMVFKQTVDGEHNLIVSTESGQAGSVTFEGIAGGTTPLASITAHQDLSSVNLKNNITTTGSQTYSGKVLLAGSVNLVAGTDTVTFGSTVDGAFSLEVGKTGTETKAVFDGVVGGNTLLSGLTVWGSSSIKADIKTTGNQQYKKNVVLNAASGSNVVLSTSSSASEIIFAGTLTHPTATGTETVTLGSADTNVHFAGNVSSVKNLQCTGTVVLDDDVTIAADNMAFSKGIDGSAHNLTLTGNATISASSQFKRLAIDNSSITAATTVKFLGGSAQTINNVWTETDGVNPVVFFKGNSETNVLTITSTGTTKWLAKFSAIPKVENFKFVKIGYSSSVENDGSTAKQLSLLPSNSCVNELVSAGTKTCLNWFISKYYWRGSENDGKWTTVGNWSSEADRDVPFVSFPTNDGSCEIEIANPPENKDLDLGFGVDFNEDAAIASEEKSIRLKKLIVPDGKKINAGDCTITVLEEAKINGTFALYGSQTSKVLDKTGTGTISWGDNSVIEYTGGTVVPAAERFSSIVQYKNLVISGNAKITGNIKAESIDISAETLTESDEFGAAILSGPVELNKDVTFETGTGDTALALSFAGPVSGSHSLTTSGDGQINFNCDSVLTPGKNQIYNGKIVLVADTTLTAAKVTFNSTVEGSHNLTVNANLAGGAGCSSIKTKDNRTAAEQIYNGTVVLNSEEVTLSGSGITFGGAVTSNKLVVFGTANINGGTISSSGKDQIYNGKIVLGADTTLTAEKDGANSNVTFNSTVEGSHNLTVNANLAGGTGCSSIKTKDDTTAAEQIYNGTVALNSEEVTFSGSGITFGGAVTSNKLVVSGTANINGGTISSSGKDQIYNDKIVLGADTTLTAEKDGVNGIVTFNTEIAGGTNTLVINAETYFATDTTLTASSVTFNGNVWGAKAAVAADILSTLPGGITFNNSSLDLTKNSTDINGTVINVSDLTSVNAVDGDQLKAVKLSAGKIELGSNAWNSGALTLSDSTAMIVRTGAFSAESITIGTGARFTQSGKNENAGVTPVVENIQTVGAITSYGTMIWDSTAAGGTLVLTGNITEANGEDIQFNKKNVTIGANIGLSGIFYNLEIPSGITATNSRKITVRKNLTVDGSYIHSGKPLILGATGSFNSENGIISGANTNVNLGNTTVTQNTTTKTFSIENLSFTSLNLNDNTTAAGAITFGSSVTADSILNDAGTNFPVTFENNVTAANAVTFNTTGSLVFGDTAADVFEFSRGLEITSASSVDFAGIIKALPYDVKVASPVNLAKDVTVIAANATFGSTVTGSLENAEAGTSGTVFAVKANAHLNGNVIAQKSLFGGNVELSAAEVSITSKDVQFNKSITSNVPSKLTVSGNAYFAGTEDSTVDLGGSSEPLSVSGDIFIHAPDVTVTVNLPVRAAGSIVLFNGNVICTALCSSVFAEKDFVLLNGTESGIARYYLPDRPCVPVLAEYPSALPDGTAISHETHSSSLTASGITLKAGQNFYDNGVDLDNLGAWNLILKDNMNAASAFAELYDAKIAGCSASAFSGTAYLSCAEAGEDADCGGNNVFVCFSRPEIAFAATMFDNIIKVSFKDSATGEVLSIENSENEISAFAAHLTNGTVQYEPFVDLECNTSTDGAGDISEFYLKTVSGTWKTDATGSSAGNSDSTDLNGNAGGLIPQINIPHHLNESGEYAGFRDCHKNRIAQTVYTETTDSCPPVLVAVRTGQELHSSIIADQKPYDAHNFIEFQYSEPVSFSGTNMMLADQTDASNLNQQSGDSLGAITNNSEGFVVSGLGSFEKGKIQTGTENVPDCTGVHGLYRKFSLVADETRASYQTHRIRLGIAAFVEETPVVDGVTYNRYKGYIDEAVLPSGSVVPETASSIIDASGNPLLTRSVEHHELSSLTVDNGDSGVYGSWDVIKPAFAVYNSSNTDLIDASDCSEIIGSCENDAVSLNRIEFHMLDNEISTSDENEWYSQVGWCVRNDSEQLYKDYSYAADIFGGSRAFDSDTARRTSGGLRYGNLYDKASYFKYSISSSPDRAFDTKNITGGVKSSMFYTLKGDSRDSGSADSLYYAIYLKETNLPLKTTFTISYDESGCITDLAGNRLKSATVKSIDRVSPRFNISFAKISSDKLYVVFNKRLNLEEITLTKINGEKVTGKISDSLRFVKIQGDQAFPVDDLRIADPSADPEVVFRTEHYTGLVFTLNRTVTLSDVKNYYIQCYSQAENGFKDPLTSVSGVSVTFIQDGFHNYMIHCEAHALSDFAIDAVTPVYAYDDRLTDAGSNVSVEMYKDGSYAVHDWNREQQNYGTLMTNHDITVVSNVQDGADGLENPAGLVLYADNKMNADSVSGEYNKNASADWRVWIPSTYLENGISKPASAIPGISQTVNGPVMMFSGATEEDSENENQIKIRLPWEQLSEFGCRSGDQINFLFSLADQDGNSIKICHAPVYDELAKRYSEITMQPLFAARLLNENDPASLDLWSFRLKDITLQRGNVTVLNNVINATHGEQATIQVNMPSEGPLSVIVMTLDGNVVQYLQHGTTSAGEHHYVWNGKTKSGKTVARGLYFVRVFGNGIDETRKVMVVKD